MGIEVHESHEYYEQDDEEHAYAYGIVLELSLN